MNPSDIPNLERVKSISFNRFGKVERVEYFEYTLPEPRIVGVNPPPKDPRQLTLIP